MENMKKILLIPIILGLALCSAACSSDAGNSTPDPFRHLTKRSDKTQKNREADHSDKLMDMKLNMVTDTGMVHARLYDNAATKDFIALLPLTLTLEDFNNTEKIARLPKRLSTSKVADGYTPHKGDIAFYAPWGNLCIFYRDFRYSPGLVPLGKTDNEGTSKLATTRSVTISIDGPK